MKIEEEFKDIRIIHPVKNIKIRDFGVIKEADITFKRGLNIIKGKSASGKTTLIEYLASRYKAKTLGSLSTGELNAIVCVGIIGFFKDNSS